MDFSKIDLEEHQTLARFIIKKASYEKFKRRSDFEKFRNKIVKEHNGVIFHNLYFIKAYNDLLEEGEIKECPDLLKFIRKRGVRTLSGVAPVTVMTKPYPCPGRCVYCPTDVRMPKSYLPSQPAAQRAFRQRFNPYTQVFVRLKALRMTGHEVSKVELRVIGGTWSAYPKSYQTWFLRRCLQAMNEFPKQIKHDMKVRRGKVKSAYGVDDVNTVLIRSLKRGVRFTDAVKDNEKALVRCIGINVETRPDFIDSDEVQRLRRIGVTKVEMGVQTIDDRIQKLTGRGHTMKDVINATRLLKDAGFKIGYHMMPNLPGATADSDKKMVGELFLNSNFHPDYLKIYPCVVLPKARLYNWHKIGKYKSYSDKVLEDVLAEELKSVPEWCRVDRIARDIPFDEVASGFRASNIRQILEARLEKEGAPARDIRAREVKDEKIGKSVLIEREYEASGGLEWFLSYEDLTKNKLIALLRLRFPGKVFISELKGAALVREVHVYGQQIAVGDRTKGEKQHVGWGTKLMKQAEKRAKSEGYKKIAVIAGIGTREYYKKLGYNLKGTYMIKPL